MHHSIPKLQSSMELFKPRPIDMMDFFHFLTK
jgi:hypothetical protein